MAIDKVNEGMGMAVIVRDNNRETCICCEKFHQIGNPISCCCWGLGSKPTLHAVEFSCDLGLQKFILERDALQVVNVVKSTERKWSKYDQIVEDTSNVQCDELLVYLLYKKKCKFYCLRFSQSSNWTNYKCCLNGRNL